MRFSRWMVGVVCLLSAAQVQAALQVDTSRLGHGVKVWYVSNDRVPVVDVMLSFEGAGYASDPEGKSGRAAFTAALLDEGAGDLDSTAFNQALEAHAITLQASTDEDRLQVHVRCLREDAPRAGELLALALSKPRLDALDQARIKAQFHSLLRQLEESGRYQAQYLLAQRAFAGHPYANAPYGTDASLQALTAQDARDFLTTHVTRGTVLVAAAGDVDHSLLDQMLGPVIEALGDGGDGAATITPIAVQGGGEQLQRTLPLPQTQVAFVAPGVARDDKRFYAAYLLNHILGGNALDSRLASLRRQQGLVYDIGTALETRRATAAIGGTLATRNRTAAEAISKVKAVLAEVRAKGVTAEECADAKSYVLGALPRQLDSSSAISSMLMTMQVQHLGSDYLKDRADLFHQVSCADINAVAAELLAPERFLFATVGGTTDEAAAPPPATPARASDVR